MKRILNLLLTLLLCLSLVGCNGNVSDKDITIVYTNDTHTYINNTIKQDDGTYKDGLRFASVKALKDELTDEGKSVILVDAGDYIQGTAYGKYDDGESIIDIMNATGYDLATFGNHEFDYGMEQLEKLIAKADFSYICSNLYNVQTDEPYIDAYKIIEKDGVKVGFIGVTTPETMLKESTFLDENGNPLYTFVGYEDKQALYDLVQEKIDEIKDKVDYVVLLGHLGVQESAMISSYELINNTNGIDLFIDGHSHTVMEEELVKDNKGNDVVLTQTGSYLKNIGVATLSKKDGISTSLVGEYDKYDENTTEVTNVLLNNVEIWLGQIVGQNKCDLTIYDSTSTNKIQRAKETAIVDFTADSYYYYFNEVAGFECDIAINNGSGVKKNLDEGLVTLMDLYNTSPYGNTLMSAYIKGSDLKEYISEIYLDYDLADSTGTPGEMSDSVFFSGLYFDLDMSKDPYTVDNIYIFNKENNEYEPLDLDKEYIIAGTHYLFGKTEKHPCLKNIEPIATYVCLDYMATAAYVEAFKEEDGLPTITTANSPLKSLYSNFSIDYENYLGNGNVRVIK